MPVGKYKTFGDCVRAQRNMGHGIDSSHKICGHIEKKTKAAKKKK